MTDVFTIYAWVKPLKETKGKIVLNAFIEIVNESNYKSNKLSWSRKRVLQKIYARMVRK